jgi:uncharacterized membrane protein YkoI
MIEPQRRSRKFLVSSTVNIVKLTSALLLTEPMMVNVAQAAAERMHTVIWAEDKANKSDIKPDGILREIEAFKASPVSLRQALAIARERHVGSRIVDISFDGSSDLPIYRVMTSRADRVWQDTVDARTGVVVGAGSESSVADLEASDRQLLVRLRSVRQEMLEAILVAERNTAGKALSAGLAVDRGRLQFVIVCVVGDDLKQVLLDPPRAAVDPRK